MRTQAARKPSRQDHKPNQNPGRRQEFLDAIEAFIAEHHYSPSVRDLSDIADVSVATVKHYLNDLRARGLIDWADGKQRTIHFVHNGAPAGVSETGKEAGCESPSQSSRRPRSSPSAPRREQPPRK